MKGIGDINNEKKLECIHSQQSSPSSLSPRLLGAVCLLLLNVRVPTGGFPGLHCWEEKQDFLKLKECCLSFKLPYHYSNPWITKRCGRNLITTGYNLLKTCINLTQWLLKVLLPIGLSGNAWRHVALSSGRGYLGCHYTCHIVQISPPSGETCAAPVAIGLRLWQPGVFKDWRTQALAVFWSTKPYFTGREK